MSNKPDEHTILLIEDLQSLALEFSLWTAENAFQKFWDQTVQRLKKTYPTTVITAILAGKIIEKQRAQINLEKYERWSSRLFRIINSVLVVLISILTMFVLLIAYDPTLYESWQNPSLIIIECLIIAGVIVISLNWFLPNPFLKSHHDLDLQIQLLEDVLTKSETDDVLDSEFITEVNVLNR